jgi:hypothetical protein
VLHWLLPLGRVVWLDAALNAAGAVALGLLVRHVQQAVERVGAVRRG